MRLLRISVTRNEHILVHDYDLLEQPDFESIYGGCNCG